MHIRNIAIAAVICACAAGAAADERRRLSGAQVEALILGNTMRGPVRARNRMVEYAYYHEQEGRLRGSLGADSGDKGTWRIRDDDVHCMKFYVYFEAAERCYQWYESGGQYTLENVDVYRASDLTVWRIDEGNPDGF